ncbi:MAG: DUF2125 domain-containing protein [Hyphomicrobiales bacterium]|nr:DUF2125 domain-containing protein [Hyphomicrobiales bacterium]
MTDPQAVPAPSGPRGRWPLYLALGVAVAAAAWTAGWTWARSRAIEEMDARLAGLERQGVRVVCPERSVGGYPFRLEISCRDPGVEIAARGLGGSVAALRVVAQIWDPKHVILEADGPLVGEEAGKGRIEATWRRLSMSLRWRPGAVDRASLSIEGLDTTLHGADGRTGRLKAEHWETHGRNAGERAQSLEVVASAAGAALWVEGRPVGPPRSDVSLEANLVDALPPGPGEAAKAFAARGGRIAPIRASFSVGGVRVAGKGELTLGADGLLDGMIGFAAQGLEAVVAQPAALGAETAGLLGGFILLGKPSNDPELPGRRLDLVIDHGRPRFGRLLLPPMAPAFHP